MTLQEKEIADLKAKVAILEKSISAIVYYLNDCRLVKDKKGQIYATSSR